MPSIFLTKAASNDFSHALSTLANLELQSISEVAEQQGSLQLRTSMPYSWCYLQAIPYTWGFIRKASDKKAMLSSTPENPASDIRIPVSLVR
jgi:hypothetical protein